MGGTYIPAPDRSYPPNGTALSLGKIWTNPMRPGSCINLRHHEAIPEALGPFNGYKGHFKHVEDSQRRSKIGIWARFLQYTGVGAELAYKRGTSFEYDYQFEKLDTKFFDPDDEYIKMAVKVPEVEKKIRHENCQTPLYLVTGIKIARGAKMVDTTEKNRDVTGGIMASGSSAAVAATAGLEASTASQSSGTISFSESSDFVFAYRINEIFYHEGNWSHDQYNKGAVYGISTPAEAQEKHDENRTDEPEILVDGLDLKNQWTKHASVALEHFHSHEEDEDEFLFPVYLAKG